MITFVKLSTSQFPERGPLPTLTYMCRFELLGRGLLYWQQRKTPANDNLSSRWVYDRKLQLPSDTNNCLRELEAECSTRSSSPSPANRPPSSTWGLRKIPSLKMLFPSGKIPPRINCPSESSSCSSAESFLDHFVFSPFRDLPRRLDSYHFGTSGWISEESAGGGKSDFGRR